ncbi:MAG: hypothetical protein QXR30_03870 [Candidatus Woesearchaeota archaeon]
MKFKVEKYYNDFYSSLLSNIEEKTVKFSKKFSDEICLNCNIEKIKKYTFKIIKLPFKIKFCGYDKLSKKIDKNNIGILSEIDGKNKQLSVDNFEEIFLSNIIEEKLVKCYNIVIDKLLALDFGYCDYNFNKNNCSNLEEVDCFYIKGEKYRYVFWGGTNDFLNMNNVVNNIENNFDNLFVTEFNDDYIVKLINVFKSVYQNCLVIDDKNEMFFIRDFEKNNMIFNLVFTKNFLFKKSSNFPNIVSIYCENFQNYILYSYNELYNCAIEKYCKCLFSYEYLSEFMISLNSNAFTGGEFGSKYALICKKYNFKINRDRDVFDNCFFVEICFTNYHDLNPKNIFGGGILNFVKFSGQNIEDKKMKNVLFYNHVDRIYKKEKYQLLGDSVIIDYSDTKKLMNNLSGPAFISVEKNNDENKFNYEFSINNLNLKEDEFLKKLCEIYNNDEFPLEKFLMKYFC